MATKTKRVTSQSIRESAKRDNSPKWDGAELLDADTFSRKFRQAMDWYRLDCTDKSLKPKVIDWMGRAGYDKNTIQAFKKTKDSRCSSTTGAVAACLIKGMPAQRDDFNSGRNTEEWLRTRIAEIIDQGKDDLDDSEVDVKKEIKAVAPVITIQDRLRDAAGEMSEEIDYAIDQWITDPENFDPKAFKVVNLLRGKGAKAAHARFIKGFFIKGQQELLELTSGNADDQLREAYSHLPRKHIKKLVEFYESVMNACEQISTEAKAQKKPRAKKVVPAEKLVAKLKFKISDDKLGISSVPAASLVGAAQAVIYNTKTRKLGIYTALNSEGLKVKGTSIINFTEKSFQKTLRKPDIQIKEFKDQNTANRVSTWFNKIKSTEVKLNGRINAEIILLKVFK